MYCQRYFGGTTTLRIAVVGAPQSGKTTLLHDLTLALQQMGCTERKVAADSPRGSFATFAFRASRFQSSSGQTGFLPDEASRRGALPPTATYVCRPEDHYRAVVTPQRSLHRVAIDFLDVPHAVFDDGSTLHHRGTLDRMKLFLMLRSAIERQDELFSVVTYENPAHQRMFIVEPSDKALLALGISHNLRPAIERSARRRVEYMDWPQIYRELDDALFMRGKKKNITGRQLMQRFDIFLTDSLLCTIRMLWAVIASHDHLSLDDMEAHDVLRYFYILAYCQQATDIIICDRLFLPHDAEGPSYNFEDLTASLAQFITHHRRRPPRVYLAFTAADHLMSHPATRSHLAQLVRSCPPQTCRDTAYTTFRDALLASLHTPATPHAGIDPDIATRLTTLGTHLLEHLRTRVGATMSYGMWHLLRVAYPRSSRLRPLSFLRQLQCRLRRQQMPQQAFAVQPLLPPQTYFTASPIDTEFRVYDALPTDPSQFVATAPDGTIHALHVDLQRGSTSPFCFGSYQLMSDIFRLAGISIPSKPIKEKEKSK